MPLQKKTFQRAGRQFEDQALLEMVGDNEDQGADYFAMSQQRQASRQNSTLDRIMQRIYPFNVKKHTFNDLL